MASGYSSILSGGDDTAKAEPSTSDMTDDPDDISVTSTVYEEEDSQKEYEVEDILAQDVTSDGATLYFVKWEGYPLEKCTWEPEENMGHELLQNVWESKRKLPGYRPFDFKLIIDAVDQMNKRHFRRNAKRRRLGLPLTEPINEHEVGWRGPPLPPEYSEQLEQLRVQALEHASEVLESTADQDREKAKGKKVDVSTLSTPLQDTAGDSEDDVVVIESLSTPAKQKQDNNAKEVKVPAKVAHSTSKEAVTASPSETKKGFKGPIAAKRKETPTVLPAGPDETNLAKQVTRKENRSKGVALPQSKPRPTTTSGTSKTDSEKGGQQAASRTVKQSKTSALSSSQATASSSKISSAATTVGGPKTFSARKSGFGSQEAGGNAFISGAKIQTRRTLLDAISEPLKDQKHFFQNYRFRRLAELREREKEDRAIAPEKLATKLFPIAQGPSSTPFSSADEPAIVHPPGTPPGSSSPPSAAVGPLPSLRDGSTAAAKKPKAPKKKKSVRFLENDGDATVGEPQQPAPAAEATDSHTGDKSSTDRNGSEQEQQLATRSVTKRLALGTQSKPIKIILHGVPSEGEHQAVLDDFLEQETLQFSYLCLAETFLEQFAGIRSQMLFSGNITSASASEETSQGASAGISGNTAVSSQETLREQTATRILPKITSVSEERLREQAAAGFARNAASTSEERLREESVEIPGNTASAPEETMLEIAAEKMKSMASGLFLARNGYCIILYPAQCEDWNEQQLGLPPNETSAVLRYFVFSTYFDCTPLLQPLVDIDIDVPTGVSEREYLLRHFFQFDRESYFQLLPDRARGKQGIKRNIFLTFPPSSSPSMLQVAFWLRAIDTDSVLYLCTDPGAWMAFQNKVSKSEEAGVVIIHELMTWAVRRIPGLNSLLLTRKSEDCVFWSLSQCILSPPLFPSFQLPSDADGPEAVPGWIRWTQLFPDGLALLVTPSFIVSEPQRVYELFKWVLKAHLSRTMSISLVAAWGISDYLKDLADEKIRLRQDILRDSSLQEPERDIKIQQMGVSVSHCQYRYEAWHLLKEICALSETERRWSVEGDTLAVVYAGDVVDANDEQSLVNWFGWWTTVHMDQYRSFYVLGSNLGIRGNGAGRGRRRIRVPNFSSTTITDPDIARERLYSYSYDEVGTPPSNADLAAPGTASSSTELPGTASASSAPTNAISTNSGTAGPVTAKGQRFPGDSPHALTAALMRYSGLEGFYRIYGFVVLWKDSDEAFRFGSLNSDHHTIKNWFDFTWPFTIPTKDYRTYIGFFYSIDESSGRPEKAGTKPMRHPWVVIYRPVEPHRRPFRNTELVFWDVRAKANFRGREFVREAELTSTQRAVVDYVRENGSVKNEGLDLSAIWIGGQPDKPGGKSPTGNLAANELDITVEYLDSLASDFRSVLPPSQYHLTARGFKRVFMPGKEPQESRRASHSSSSPMELDGDDISSESEYRTRGANGAFDSGITEKNQNLVENDEREDETKRVKILFHAPSGSRLMQQTETRCRNHLYESVQQVRARNPHASTMIYQYRPTVDWYQEQVGEGRGFEHIHVDGFDTFFDKFQIPKDGGKDRYT